MENIKLVPSFKSEKEIKNFFLERFSAQHTFNQKVEDFKKEAEQILEDNKEKVLYSILFPDYPDYTCVRLSKDALNNFYDKIKNLYSDKDGILLHEIQIVRCEYLSDLKLDSSLRIKFDFVQNQFNNNWNSFNFKRLSFDDKNFELKDNSMGACLNPKFIDSEKYFLVKDLLSEVINLLSKVE